MFCGTFFRSTASQGFQNTKWPAVLYSEAGNLIVKASQEISLLLR